MRGNSNSANCNGNYYYQLLIPSEQQKSMIPDQQIITVRLHYFATYLKSARHEDSKTVIDC